MRKIIYLALVLGLVSCGPSSEEIAAYEQVKKDSLALIPQVDTIEEQKVQEYYLASDFGLIVGEVVKFEPSEEFIETWKSNGGEIPDGVIYIHIQHPDGRVSVMTCDNRAWLNLDTGDILK